MKPANKIAAHSLSLLIAVAPIVSFAATVTAPFVVRLTVVASCNISANALNFGTATSGLATAIQNTTTLAVTCSNTTPYQVGLDAGTVSGSTTTTRLMAGTTAGNTATTVSFKLNQTSYSGSNWGNVNGTDTQAGTGSGSAQTVTVYGTVLAQATPVPDTYQTTVTATAYF